MATHSTPGIAATVLLAVSVLAPGCATKKEPVYKTYYYRCSDTSRFAVKEMDKNRVELARGPNRYVLKPAEAATGTKYASDKASYWNKGDEVVFEVKDKTYTGCKLDSVQSSDDAIRRLQMNLPSGTDGPEPK